MLKTYLMENYGYNEPIFLNDLSVKDLSENAVRQSVKRLTASGFLERYDNGIYYILYTEVWRITWKELPGSGDGYYA